MRFFHTSSSIKLPTWPTVTAEVQKEGEVKRLKFERFGIKT